MLNLLKSKRFLPLFITQFFGAFNDNLFKNAFLIWLTYDAAQKLNISAQIFVTIASTLFILPFFLFSSLAGQIADRFEKSKLIQIIKITEIIIMAFCFVGFYFSNIFLLLFLLFLMGLHSTFFGPLKYSLLPQHLKNEELISGNALIESGTFFAILFGTIIGGIVVRTTYGIEIISIIAISCAIIGYISSLYIIKSPATDLELKIGFNIFSQSLKIIQYTRKEKEVWLAIIGISWFWFIGMSFLSQIPSYAKNIVMVDEYVIALFLTLLTIGTATGSIICSKILKGKINKSLVPISCIGITSSIIVFCLASYFYQNSLTSQELHGLVKFISANIYSSIIIISLFSLSLFLGIYMVPLYTIIQYYGEEKYRSRIIAANNIINALFMVVSGILMILLLKLKLSLIAIFFLIGIANIFFIFRN